MSVHTSFLTSGGASSLSCSSSPHFTTSLFFVLLALPNRYGVEGYSSADARRLVLLNHFRKNAGVTDPRVIELMLDNGRMEIEETMQQWKQKPHIMALLEPEVQPVDPWEPEEYQRLCVK